jgi:hypothetical protein
MMCMLVHSLTYLTSKLNTNTCIACHTDIFHIPQHPAITTPHTCNIRARVQSQQRPSQMKHSAYFPHHNKQSNIITPILQKNCNFTIRHHNLQRMELIPYWILKMPHTIEFRILPTSYWAFHHRLNPAKPAITPYSTINYITWSSSGILMPNLRAHGAHPLFGVLDMPHMRTQEAHPVLCVARHTTSDIHTSVDQANDMKKPWQLNRSKRDNDIHRKHEIL